MDDYRDGFAGEGVVENEFTFFEIFHIHSAKLVKEAVRTTVNDQVGW